MNFFKSFLKKTVIVLLVLFIGLIIFFSIKTGVTKNIDTYVYSLPFKQGTQHRVVQGYGGLFSHKHSAAIDFAMPVGTPVYAAREGMLYFYKDDNDEGGPFVKYKDKANYLVIKHNDGSFGCYWHLQKNGVVIKKGFVNKGDLIGYSGKTGFVLFPHLHFSVKRKLNYDKESFVQTQFLTTSGIQIIKNGRRYKRP